MSTPAGNQALGEVRKVLHGVCIADCPPELREKLAQYDTNGNGIIDPNELPDPMSAEMTYLKVSSFPKKVQPLLHEIDDEKNGKIEMDELTEILTVYSDLKKANKEGSIAIKTLPKEIQPTLKAFDVDGDGTVAPMELARGAELYKDSKKTAKRLTIFSGVLLVILCALVGVIVGLTAVVVEASKETKTDSKTGITFAKGSSKPSATAKVTKTDSIYNAVKKSASALRAIGSLTLGKPDGSSLIYSITGAETHGGAPGKANAVAFYSARGDVINVTATSLKVTKEDGTIVMTDTVVAEKSRRRRLLGSGSDTGSKTTSDLDSGEDKDEDKDKDKDKDEDYNEDYMDKACKSTSDLLQKLAAAEKAKNEAVAAKKTAEDALAAAKASATAQDKLTQAELRRRVKIWTLDQAAATGAFGEMKDWDVSSVTDMSGLFDPNSKPSSTLDPYSAMTSDCPQEQKQTNLRIPDISSWDVSKVTDMSNMFKGAKFDDGDWINAWDISNKKVQGMFDGSNFNKDISNWKFPTNMKGMFEGASAFNQPIGNWDVSKVTDMSNMFYGASAFNQPIGNWDVSKVTNMEYVFDGASAFNQPIGNWDVSNVTNMEGMFRSADAFKQDINSWDTSNVKTMGYMFMNNKNFNQPIGSWKTSKVESMKFMFTRAKAFNQDISNWDTSNVRDMENMFEEAVSFNQDISSWDTSKVENTYMERMFSGATSSKCSVTCTVAAFSATQCPNKYKKITCSS
ncbi:EF-hand domain-containing protein [Pseudoscourfieldia marina]